MVECCSEADANAAGKLRSDAKEYVVQEGDVMLLCVNLIWVIHTDW